MRTCTLLILSLVIQITFCLFSCSNRVVASPAFSPAEGSTTLGTSETGGASQVLQLSGSAKVGQKMPFFSGWRIGPRQGQAYSLRKAMKTNKQRYVLTICASWCKPCIKGLERLSKAKGRFLSTQTELIVLVADQSAHGRELYERFGFDWAKVVVDEFKTFALRLAPSANQGSEGLSLPKTIVFNKEGIVETIVGVEGNDYIDLILSGKKR